MNDSKPNLKFEYLYRDAGNYKQYGSIVLANPSGLNGAEVSDLLTTYLIDGLYFLPEHVSVPRVEAYPYNPELDHQWYEVEGLTETDEEPTDGRSVEEFIAAFEREREYA